MSFYENIAKFKFHIAPIHPPSFSFKFRYFPLCSTSAKKHKSKVPSNGINQLLEAAAKKTCIHRACWIENGKWRCLIIETKAALRRSSHSSSYELYSMPLENVNLKCIFLCQHNVLFCQMRKLYTFLHFCFVLDILRFELDNKQQMQ